MARLFTSGLIGLFLVIGLSSGCATKGDPPAEIVYAVAYSPSKGNIISWRSQKNLVYTLLYRNEYDRKGTPFTPLARHSYIKGTGLEIKVVDHPPLREKRRYRVRTTVMGTPGG